MAEILKTNICCLDLTQDCIDYLRSLDLNVYDGSLGSLFSVKWVRTDYGDKTVIADVDYPENLHEYHVFIHDMGNPHQREYKAEEHLIGDIASGENRYLACLYPVNTYDLRPYGLHKLKRQLSNLKNHRRIEIVFVGRENSVLYYSNAISVHDQRHFGPISNLDDWHFVAGGEKVGERVTLTEYGISKNLFESRRNRVKYYRVFPSQQYIEMRGMCLITAISRSLSMRKGSGFHMFIAIQMIMSNSFFHR